MSKIIISAIVAPCLLLVTSAFSGNQESTASEITINETVINSAIITATQTNVQQNYLMQYVDYPAPRRSSLTQHLLSQH